MGSEEKENYLRLALLLTDISPKAVRHYFDTEFDPSCLERTIRHGRNTLTDLKTKRIINQSQWNLLFPRTGLPDSTTFDVTLMVTLLKNLASIPVPDHLPPAIDCSIGAALGRIKYHRNQFAHLKDAKIDKPEFDNLWTTLSETVKILGGTTLHDETKELKTVVLDRSNKEKNEGLLKKVKDLEAEQKILKDPVPWNIREITASKLKEWKESDKEFFVTSSAKKIFKQCKENICVTIIGSSGMGKTVTLRHVALQMAECIYDVIPVHNPDDIKQYYNPNKKTLFVVDDFCGKFSADKNEIYRWRQLIENSLRYLDNTVVKIIVSCRLQVFQDELFDTLSLFKTCVCNLLSTDFKFSTNDIKSIAKIYSKGNADNIVQYAHLYDCFPLLCKLYRDNPSLDLDFFLHPFTVYETELNQMYTTHNYVSYCALALCVMFNNNVEEELLTVEIDPEIRSVFENTFEACKLNRGTSRIQIRDSLDVLINTFITKEGNVYKAIHDKLFDFLSFYFGNKIITCLLGNASIKWISERLIIDIYDLGIETEFVVIVNPQFSLLLMKRLEKEWLNGQVNHVFISLNMTNPDFRNYFLCYIQTLDKSEQDNLAQKTDLLSSKNPLICTAFYGDKKWVRWCLHHGISVNMSDKQGCSPLYAACLSSKENTNLVKILLNNKAEVNQYTTDNGFTPLYIACQNGHTDIVKILLDNKARINQCTTDNGATPLYIACENGHTDIVKILLDNKARINQCTTDNGATPLYIACQNGHTDIVKILLDNKASINQCTTDNGATPLLIACQLGHTEIVQILLANKANINQCFTHCGTTALYLACQEGHTEVVQMLLKNKADINQCTTEIGITPLIIACELGHTEIVQILLDNNAVINQSTTDMGVTPLWLACQEGHTEVVQVLLQNKAGINQCTTDFGITPLNMACQQGHTKVVQILLKNKANINQCTTDIGMTPLNIACEAGHTEIVQVLLDNKADVNQSTTDTGATPLIVACKKGNTEVVTKLLEHKADINKCTLNSHFRCSPLHIACEKGNTDIVLVLLDHNAYINQLTISLQTPLFIACMMGHQKIVKILLDNKADINVCSILNGRSPLCAACHNGHIEVVKIILDYNGAIKPCLCSEFKRTSYFSNASS